MAPLPQELTDPLAVRAILAAISQAYEENLSRHDPSVGDDAITFGIHLWKSCAFFLQEELKLVPTASSDLVQQSLAIQIGRCRLRIHKLGESELDNPEHCFPNHVGPSARMGVTAEQLQLSFESGEPPKLLDWVIGHYGSPEDGLRAIRLQAVGSERALDGSISKWESIHTLFDVSVGRSVGTGVSSPETVEVAPYPEIALLDSGEKGAQIKEE